MAKIHILMVKQQKNKSYSLHKNKTTDLYLSVRGLEPRIHRLKVGCFIQLSYALILFDFEQIRTVDMENHFGFTVQRFRPTELRNLFINLTKN